MKRKQGRVTETIKRRGVETIGEEKEILLRGKVCAYLTSRLMGDPNPDHADLPRSNANGRRLPRQDHGIAVVADMFRMRLAQIGPSREVDRRHRIDPLNAEDRTSDPRLDLQDSAPRGVLQRWIGREHAAPGHDPDDEEDHVGDKEVPDLLLRYDSLRG